MISLIIGNNISLLKSCRLSRRTFLYVKNSGWSYPTKPTMITDNTNARIKLNTGPAATTEILPHTDALLKVPGSFSMIFLPAWHRSHREEEVSVNIWYLLSQNCKVLVPFQRKTLLPRSYLALQKKMSKLMKENDCTENDNCKNNLQSTTCFQSNDKFLLFSSI